MKLLDSFAWIEYFMGSKRGVKVKDYVEGEEPDDQDRADSGEKLHNIFG